MAPLQRYGTPLLDRAAPQERTVWFRLVTRNVDRHGTIIEPAGIDTAAFLRNPVFLWMHQSGGGDTASQPPPDVVIGRVVEIDQTDDHFDICVLFDDDGPDGLASTCYRKVLAGFIRMVSIGCNALVETSTRVGDIDVPTYSKTELLECSLVIIGSNRQALKLDRAAMAAMVRDLNAAAPKKQSEQIATVAVFNADGAMLWGRRNDDKKWTTPGGHLHEGEDPRTAVMRELQEEAGIDAAGLGLKLHYLGPVELNGRFIHCFRLDLDATHRGLAVTSAGDPDQEVEEWRWVEMSADAVLPDDIKASLHAPKNALQELGVFRAVPGDAATTSLLSDFVDDGDATDIFDGDDNDTAGLVVHSIATRGVVPHKEFPLVETTWDADAAVSRWRSWASSDGSGKRESIDWKKYAECFLWFDSDDVENFASYKFPHHDIVSGKPVTVWQGVVAAAARIGQAKDIPTTDIAKMKQHLADHYKEFGKPAPWQKRSLDNLTVALKAWRRHDGDDVATLLKAAFKGDKTTPIYAGDDAVKNGPAYAVADIMTSATVHALLFPSAKHSLVEAVVWAKEHGYASNGPVAEVGDGYTHAGLVVTENSFVVEQIPEACFQPSAFGRGVKFQTVLYTGGHGISAVVGVLKTSRSEDRAELRRHLVKDVDMTMSPTSRSELRLLRQRGVDISASAIEAGRWSLGDVASTAKRQNLPQALRRDIARVVTDVAALATFSCFREADPTADTTSRKALIASTQRSHQLAHYLPRVNKIRATADRSGAVNSESSTMKKSSPEARMAYRGMIGHALEHAEMHARALEDGHVGDEHKTMHHAMAMRALDSAEEMHSVMCSAFIGDKASQEVVVDGGSVGLIYAAPPIADGELKSRFAEVASKVGKLPRSLRSVVKAELGVEDVERTEEKLLNLKGIAERFVELQTEHKRGIAAVEKAATEKLITDALDARLISPADAKRFRGINPATDQPGGEVWNKTRVERFLEERRAVGPIADIVRPGTERTVQDVTSTTVTSPTAPSPKSSLIRFGTAPTQMSEAQLSHRAAEIARHLPGIDVAKILGQVEEASKVQNAEARITGLQNP